MSRLTKHCDYCVDSECIWYDKELAKDNKCECNKSRDNCYDRSIYNKLAEYEDLEEQGLLLKLPCKVGDTVYDIHWWEEKTKKVKVGKETYYKTVHKHKVSKTKFSLYDYEDFGKTVFLTKEEAEQELKRLECAE